MARIRLYDCLLSRLPNLIGLCQADKPQVANYVNTAERRLLLCREGGDEGWYGTFAEVRFNGLSSVTPYLTLNRRIARIEAVNVGHRPMTPNNQYAEYMDFGNGRMPQHCLKLSNWFVPNVYMRNNAVTFVDPPAPGFFLRAYTTSLADVQAGLRIFFQGTDTTDATVVTFDGTQQVQGQFVPFASPFCQTPQKFNYITGIQKDMTAGFVQIMSVDGTTGVETLLLTMEPNEQVSGYRRYYFNNLPHCGCQPRPISVTAIVKLELIPVVAETDYLLFHNLEAITEECQSIRLSEIDSANSKQQAAERHTQAVRLLQGELVHYYGKTSPSVVFAPFGTARLHRAKIGQLM